MSFSANRRKEVNEIQIAPLIKWLLLAFIVGGCGLTYVYVKNQQHFLGARTREVELMTREVIAQNEVLLARISTLTSRTELQRKLEKGMIALQPIQDHAIARMVPPTISTEIDGAIRTAANERFRP